MEAIRVTTQEATTELLDLFQKHGHNEVDTARMYTNGTSEEMLGAISWQERGIKMDTKHFPTKGKNMGWLTREEWTHSPADLRKGLGNSLAALKASKLHIFYLHSPDRSVPYEDTLREVAQICEICKRNGWLLPSVYQGLYNAHQRVVEAELIPCLRTYGISFYVYSPLAGGFLTSRYTRDQTTFEAGDRFDPARPQVFKALDALRPVIKPHGITESEAALRWLVHHSVLKKELGDAVIIGASSKKRPLPADVVAALDAGWKETRVLLFSYSH
ncbi:NADP-dependent oxidoreductase domain-containing protein [Mycena leptocephala]|nr:NADP-dependent oxidoreductase domain-containing protein [Mycena leptocephala]